MPLDDTVSDPMKTNVHGFGHLLPNDFVGYSNRCGIIYLDGGGWLGMTHFVQGCSDGHGGLSIEEKGAVFGFSCGSHDISKNFAQNTNKTIEEGSVLSEGNGIDFEVAEELYPTGMTPGFGN